LKAKNRTCRQNEGSLAQAGHALWMFVVQREACGLRDSRTIMRDYSVPGEVQQCMGAAPTTPMRPAT